jgi:hypothetical protein
MLRKDKRPARIKPDELSAATAIPFGTGNIFDVLLHGEDAVVAKRVAKNVFQSILRLLGIAEAKRIFSDLAWQPSKTEIEEMNNILLLQTYIDKGGGEVDPLARYLFKRGKTIGVDFLPRGSKPINEAKRKKQLKEGVEIKPWAGIAKQLYRLLGKCPKDASPVHRALFEEARKLRRPGRGRPRKR